MTDETTANDPNRPPIRVEIIGDHPWAGMMGWIEPVNGRYKKIRIMGAPPVMYKVKLDNGHYCFASRKQMVRLKKRKR